MDTNELRRLAEICAGKAPLEDCDIEFIDCGTGWVRDQRRFIAAASPTTILALLDEIERLEASNRACVKTVAEWGAKYGALQAKVDQWKQAAELNMLDYQQAYRERDEAREAVKRLAEALEELANDAQYAMRSNDEAIAREALADPVVKRIVEAI